jgi:REP element-mobilizing transposase RayT
VKKCAVVELNMQIDHIHLVVKTPIELNCFRVNDICEGANNQMAVREVSLSQEEQALE